MVWVSRLHGAGFKHLGIDIEFKGNGADEKAYVANAPKEFPALSKGQEVLALDPKYLRPTEVDLLLGDSSKARAQLGWEPKHDVKSLVADMMESDINLFRRDVYLTEGGHKVLEYHE